LRSTLLPPLGSVTGYIHRPSLLRLRRSSLLVLHAQAKSYCESALRISNLRCVSGLETTPTIGILSSKRYYPVVRPVTRVDRAFLQGLRHKSRTMHAYCPAYHSNSRSSSGMVSFASMKSLCVSLRDLEILRISSVSSYEVLSEALAIWKRHFRKSLLSSRVVHSKKPLATRKLSRPFSVTVPKGRSR